MQGAASRRSPLSTRDPLFGIGPRQAMRRLATWMTSRNTHEGDAKRMPRGLLDVDQLAHHLPPDLKLHYPLLRTRGRTFALHFQGDLVTVECVQGPKGGAHLTSHVAVTAPAAEQVKGAVAAAE